MDGQMGRLVDYVCEEVRKRRWRMRERERERERERRYLAVPASCQSIQESC
jgi:hypothetical protein